MFSSSTSHAYYEPLTSAQLFPTESDPFAQFAQSFLPPGHDIDRQQSLPFPLALSSAFPLPELPPAVDKSIFSHEGELPEGDYPNPPLSPSTAFDSEVSGNFSSGSFSSAHSSPTPSSDAQYSSDTTSPFQLSRVQQSIFDDDASAEPVVSERPVLTPALLASLSFDPQQLLGALTTDLSAPASAEPKKRNRIPGLTAQQRAALKRQKHREIDTQRRHREQAAISKLHKLVRNPVGGEAAEKSAGAASGRKRARGEWLDEAGNAVGNDGEQAEGDEEEKREDEEDEDDESARSKDKVTILEHSARRLEQMQSVIHQLTAACTAQQQSNRHLLSQLQQSNGYDAELPRLKSSTGHSLALFHPPVAQQLDANLGQQSLYASLFLSASAPMFVIRCDTGYVVDVNRRMLDESGWTRDHLVGRLMTAPYDALVSDSTHDVERIMRNAGSRVLVASSDGRWVPASKQAQYESSKRKSQQLYAGQVNQIDAVWRQQMSNGKVYEVNCRSWISGFRDVVNAEGRLVRRPNTAVFVCDTLNAVCVDGE